MLELLLFYESLLSLLVLVLCDFARRFNVLYLDGQDMTKVSSHFVRGNDPKKFASMLVNFMGKVVVLCLA